jgi:membrane protease YdiL (CAAX protease family)
MAAAISIPGRKNHKYLYSGLVFLGALAFSAVLAWLNYAYYNWLSPQFEGSSNQTVWGVIQRLYLIIPIIAISLWKPRQIGFQIGKTFQHMRMLIIMLVLNVAVILGYKLLAGSTPYSGMDMLVNEVITVPLVEEIVWRGIVFAGLLVVLRRFLSEESSGILAGVYSGICFGLLHSTNALFGYPLEFVALQTLNATVWGVVYGIARAKTDSVYPPILLHAAMNLAVVL